jgi:hypothetical protein
VDTLTMNIKREFFARIVAKTKRIEYRDQSPYWKRRLEPLSTPFKLRLLNGMTPPVPEALVLVTRVTRRCGGYQLHLGRVLRVRRWDPRAHKPRSR